jgi:hypothetical protein
MPTEGASTSFLDHSDTQKGKGAVSIAWMNSMRKLTHFLVVPAIAFAHSVIAHEVREESYPSNHLLGSQVLLHVPEKKPTGLLVLLPAGNIHSYDEQSGYTPSGLPKLLATNSVVTLIAAPRPGLGAGVGLYAADGILQELDALIADELGKFNIRSNQVAIGGFSAGGIGAVRYAQFCATGKHRIRGGAPVFAVDSPLDYERWFFAADLHLKRLAFAGLDLTEDRSAVEELRKEFGGSPTEALEVYRRQSAASILVPDGGNARLLKDTPIRLYIEPAIQWRLENWDRDVYSSNVTDATALINILRLLGNKNAELITTSDKGRRPDGTRNPHSWSIVDEVSLAEWLMKFLAPPL